MHKLASLRKHLIDAPLPIKDAHLEVYATQGHVRSGAGGANQDFEFGYQANVLLRHYTGDPDALMYLVLLWLAQHQPDHGENPIQWEADLLDHKQADVYLAVALTETITAVAVDGGTELRHCDEPNLEPVVLAADIWDVYLRHDGDEEFLGTFSDGG